MAADKVCERCGERDCPTLPDDHPATALMPDVDPAAAFHACAAMRLARAAEGQRASLSAVEEWCAKNWNLR